MHPAPSELDCNGVAPDRFIVRTEGKIDWHQPKMQVDQRAALLLELILEASEETKVRSAGLMPLGAITPFRKDPANLRQVALANEDI